MRKIPWVFGPLGYFHPLKWSYIEIQHLVDSLEILNAPAKMVLSPKRRSEAKYCEFYQYHGHDSEQCIELRKEIKSAIRQGLLKDFISLRAEHEQKNRKRNGKDYKFKQEVLPRNSIANAKIINVINGAPTYIHKRMMISPWLSQ